MPRPILTQAIRVPTPPATHNSIIHVGCWRLIRRIGSNPDAISTALGRRRAARPASAPETPRSPGCASASPMVADEGAVAAILDRLMDDTRNLGRPVIAWHRDTRAVSVCYQVEPEDIIGAVIRAAGAMTDAIGTPSHAANFQIRSHANPAA